MSNLPYNNSNSFEAKVYPDEYIDTFTWNRFGQRLLQNDLSLSGTIGQLGAEFQNLSGSNQLIERTDFLEVDTKHEGINENSSNYDSTFSTISTLSSNFSSTYFDNTFSHGCSVYRSTILKLYTADAAKWRNLGFDTKLFDLGNELSIVSSTESRFTYSGTDEAMFYVLCYVTGIGPNNVTTYSLGLAKNGVITTLLDKKYGRISTGFIGGSAIIKLVKDDYLEVKFWFDDLSSPGGNFLLDGGIDLSVGGLTNCLTIFKIGTI